MVVFFSAAFFTACLEPPLFLAAHFAFIKAESLALAAADMGLRPVEALIVVAGADVILPALTFAHRALAAARSLALVASDMPEPVEDFCEAPLEPNVDISSRWSFSICSLI